MITILEKDGSYIAVFSNMSVKEKEAFDRVKELSEGERIKKPSGVTFNFGAAATKVRKDDGNDYYSTSAKDLTQKDTLKKSDRSVPTER